MRRPNFVKLLLWLGLAGLLIGPGLAACGDGGASTAIPAPGKASPGATPNPGQTGGTAPIAPVVGPDGQITVMAPPPTGENIPGQIFWVKENNIWQGGAGTPAVPPVTVKELGGKQLTKAPNLAIAQSPAISPDGTKMAYAFSPEPEGEQGNITIGQDIYLLDLKTGADKLLIKRDEAQGFLDQPTWSKDAKYLYFSSRVPQRDKDKNIVGENISISRLELATNTREKLLEDAREPAPLPDGKLLAFVSVQASTGTYETNLKILNRETKEVKTLLDPKLGFIGTYFPRPSPDGQLIAFAGAGGPDINPYANPTATPAPGSGSAGKTALDRPGGFALGLTVFQPFGQKPLALQAPPAHGVPYDLWLIKPDGSGLKRLTTLFEDQPMAAWSRDGKQIAFLAGQGFYMINSDGSNLIKRSDRGAHAGFDWKN
jgi:dipeptidyl aminopeptidase/acylaminoacyl peptidase